MKYSILTANMALRKVADLEGVSYESVKEEIRKIIEVGMNNQDPLIRARWNKICVNGKPPTPEQFLVFLADTLEQEDET